MVSTSGVSNPTSALMIGVVNLTQSGAEQAGVDFCAATYGFGLTPEILKKHHFKMKIASPLELLEKI